MAVAQALDLPRGRVRPWLNGKQPDAARAVTVARERGWIDPDLDSETFRGLNACVAWCLSGGSVGATNYVPRFILWSDADRDRLERIATATGVDLTTLRSLAADTDRPAECKPAEHGCVLGRVLAVLGVPVGYQRSMNRSILPPYIERMPRLLQEEFVRVVAHNNDAFDADGPVTICTDRPESYCEGTAALVSTVTDADATPTDDGVVLPQPAIANLADRPPVLAEVTTVTA
jgi:hypothetical protein